MFNSKIAQYFSFPTNICFLRLWKMCKRIHLKDQHMLLFCQITFHCILKCTFVNFFILVITWYSPTVTVVFTSDFDLKAIHNVNCGIYLNQVAKYSTILPLIHHYNYCTDSSMYPVYV